MATQELDAPAAKAEMKDEGKKKPRPNNPEEASEFMEQINEAVDKFAKPYTSMNHTPYRMYTLTLWAGTMNFFPKLKTILLMPHLRQYWSWRNGM